MAQPAETPPFVASAPPPPAEPTATVEAEAVEVVPVKAEAVQTPVVAVQATDVGHPLGFDRYSFPHLFDNVVGFADTASFMALRGVSEELRNHADKVLFEHIAITVPANGGEIYELRDANFPHSCLPFLASVPMTQDLRSVPFAIPTLRDLVSRQRQLTDVRVIDLYGARPGHLGDVAPWLFNVELMRRARSYTTLGPRGSFAPPIIVDYIDLSKSVKCLYGYNQCPLVFVPLGVDRWILHLSFNLGDDKDEAAFCSLRIPQSVTQIEIIFEEYGTLPTLASATASTNRPLGLLRSFFSMLIGLVPVGIPVSLVGLEILTAAGLGLNEKLEGAALAAAVVQTIFDEWEILIVEARNGPFVPPVNPPLVWLDPIPNLESQISVNTLAKWKAALPPNIALAAEKLSYIQPDYPGRKVWEQVDWHNGIVPLVNVIDAIPENWEDDPALPTL